LYGKVYVEIFYVQSDHFVMVINLDIG